MRQIRNVEFRFHMEKDSTIRPILTPFPPSMDDFEKCPIWHFIEEESSERDPTVTIMLTSDGTGKTLYDYNFMFGLLEELMHSLRTAEFEHVVVKLGLGFNANERRALKDDFEQIMGTATVKDGNEGRHMEFCPRRFKAEWEESEAVERECFTYYI